MSRERRVLLGALSRSSASSRGKNVNLDKGHLVRGMIDAPGYATEQFSSSPLSSSSSSQDTHVRPSRSGQTFPFRVFVLDKVTDFLLLGKLVVVGAVGVLSFYFFSGEWMGEIIKESPFHHLEYSLAGFP